MLASEYTPIFRQPDRYRTFLEENKHSFDDGIGRNIDLVSGFDNTIYKRNQRILSIIITALVVVIIILVCIA